MRIMARQIENNFRHFISGPVGVGKSTLARRLIESLGKTYAGFITERSECGFVLTDLLTGETAPIAIRSKDGYDPVIESFEELGVKSIREAINGDFPLLMDELGRFELQAVDFCSLVLDVCSDYSPLVVVIKDERNRFLDELRRIISPELIYLTESNREQVWKELVPQ